MKKNPASLLSALTIFLLTALILLFPEKCVSYACNGLNLWFQKMIPTLFPFMVLCGIMIRMNLTETFVKLLKPVLSPLFRVSPNCLYVIVTGFLCGFPMGAHVTAQLYERQRISRREAQFLLSFCNNIGPVYFISFALPTLGLSAPGTFADSLPLLFGMYGLPLCYGLLLRYTVYARSLPAEQTSPAPVPRTFLLEALDESVMSSLTGIARLGGYMILFNLLNIIPALFIKNGTVMAMLSCLLEITGGLQVLGSRMPFAGLCLLSFGGLSCLAQTNSMISGTDLSLREYGMHRLVLTAVSVFYYGLVI